MVSVCFYFQVHQPYRLRNYSVFEIGKKHHYYDDKKNRQIMEKVTKKCYLPTNNLIHRLIKETKGKFKVSYSISGQAIDQFEEYAPDVITSFKKLAKTGCVEFLSETYFHSLSFLYSKEEFKEQVLMHKKKIKSLFGQEPKVFRNTELIFNNELAHLIEEMGYKGIIAEGVDRILGWKSPNFIYRPKTTKKIALLLKNYKLSDDIAFRFSNRNWKEWPLTTDKYAAWLKCNAGETVNLFMDYETFGEHQWADTGIFNFLTHLPNKLLENGIRFRNPSELTEIKPVAELDIHHPISWADVERDLSAWLGNKMQHTAINEIYNMEKAIKKTKDKKLISDWRKLQTSDHFYYMCTKWFSDGDVHKYFNPYDSPYDCYITYMNVLNDLAKRINNDNPKQEFKITEKPSIMINQPRCN